MNKYDGNDNYGHPKQNYLDKLHPMSDSELEEFTADAIYWSAWANNNPRSDYHWHVDACSDECYRRDSEMYERAYKAARRKAGFD